MTESKLCSIHWFQERDIDLLLAEEFRVNAGFGQWFLERCGCDSDCVFPAVETRISVQEEGSEADVAVLFGTRSGSLYRLYVEDKITAGKMPSQLERYVQRAEAERKRGSAEGWSIALFAPRSYPDSACPEGVAFVSFEEAAEYLGSDSSDERACYRAEFLIAAADYASPRSSASRDQYAREREPYRIQFWDAVYEMLEREFPGYFIHKTQYPSETYYAPETHEWPSKRVRVDLKGHKGEVDLAFKHADYERFQRCIEEIGTSPGKLVKNKKSVALRISGLERFFTRDDHSVIETHVKETYKATKKLMDYYLEHRDIFEKAFDDGA